MQFESTKAFARSLDRQDELQGFRKEFYLPKKDGKQVIYFCGNSLGPQAKNVPAAVNQELRDWRMHGVGGFYLAKNPWVHYQDYFKRSLATVVGAKEKEIAVMNTLTVNLHLLLLSFYRPTKSRYKIIMEAGAFPSDQYAVETEAKLHGFDPGTAVVEVHPREGEKLLREEDLVAVIHQHRKELALVLLGGINYYTGQLFDIGAITKAAHEAGALAGFDLAHAAGNVPLRLHDWGVDFAVWCSYKYLNGGPGAVGGAYIHERYGTDPDWLRLAGWWGHDEKTRFKMDKTFRPQSGAGGWQISTAQILNMVSLKAALEVFDRAGIARLRKKSLLLTAYLEFLLHRPGNVPFEMITPSEPSQRGAQLSLFFKEGGRRIHQRIMEAGMIADYREPGVIRVAPAPLYNSFEEVYRFCEVINYNHRN